jgi:hypothetical protein
MEELGEKGILLKRFLVFALFLFFASTALAYSDISLSVVARVNGDGTAHVMEKALIALNNKEEMEAFDYNMNLGESTVTDWSRFSPGGNIRYHLSGKTVPANVKIAAKRDYTIGYSVGVVTIEYDVTSPVFNVTKIGSRKLLYKLNTNYLSFEASRTHETILPKGTQLTFELPGDAVVVSVIPEVFEKKDNVLTWFGRASGNWELVFEREEPLGEEVSEFFYELYGKIVSLIPAILVIVLLVFAVYKLAVFGKKK